MWGKARGGLTELLPQSQRSEKRSEEPGEAVDKATEAANRLSGSPDSAPASHCLWKTHSHMGPRLLPASLTHSAPDPQPIGTSDVPIEREAFHPAWGIYYSKGRTKGESKDLLSPQKNGPDDKTLHHKYPRSPGSPLLTQAIWDQTTQNTGRKPVLETRGSHVTNKRLLVLCIDTQNTHHTRRLQTLILGILFRSQKYNLCFLEFSSFCSGIS